MQQDVRRTDESDQPETSDEAARPRGRTMWGRALAQLGRARRGRREQAQPSSVQGRLQDRLRNVLESDRSARATQPEDGETDATELQTGTRATVKARTLEQGELEVYVRDEERTVAEAYADGVRRPSSPRASEASDLTISQIASWIEEEITERDETMTSPVSLERPLDADELAELDEVLAVESDELSEGDAAVARATPWQDAAEPELTLAELALAEPALAQPVLDELAHDEQPLLPAEAFAHAGSAQAGSAQAGSAEGEDSPLDEAASELVEEEWSTAGPEREAEHDEPAPEHEPDVDQDIASAAEHAPAPLDLDLPTPRDVDATVETKLEPKHEPSKPARGKGGAKASKPGAKARRTDAAERCSEPICTLTMARLLAMQGYKPRALAVYRELMRRSPDDAELRAEAEALTLD